MSTRTITALLTVTLAACGPTDEGYGQLLWDVHRPNGAKASLFGTIHSLGVDAVREKYPPAIERFDSSTLLVVEADTSNIDLDDYSRRALLEDDRPSLDTQLTPEEWSQLVRAVRGVVPESTLRRARPWYALQLVTIVDLTTKHGADWLPMDTELVQLAKARGAEVRFLETWQEQLSAIDATSDLATLKAAIALGLDAYRFQRVELEVAWSGGDAESIVERLDAQTADQKALLLDERNERWAVTLAELMKTEKRELFVAVGTAHLVYGDKRVPELLRKRGLGVARQPWRD